MTSLLSPARACVVPQDGQLVRLSAPSASANRPSNEPADTMSLSDSGRPDCGAPFLPNTRRPTSRCSAPVSVRTLLQPRTNCPPAVVSCGFFVAAAVSGRADGNGRVLGVFRRGIDERVVNVAAVPVLHGERDRRRAVREQLGVHARDLARAAVVERISLIAPLRAVIDAAQDAVVRKVEGAFIGLHRAPHGDGAFRLPPR